MAIKELTKWKGKKLGRGVDPGAKGFRDETILGDKAQGVGVSVSG